MEDSYDKFAGVADEVNGMSVEDINRFKRVFGGEGDGQYVLCVILDMCKFMEVCENERDMELNNFAKKLMCIVHWDNERKSLNTHTIIEFVRKKLRRRR